MSIGFIGAGKVGTALGLYLKQKGFLISGYYSKTLASSQQSAAKTKSLCFNRIDQLVECSDILFITTPDDQIEAAVKALSLSAKLRTEQLIIHTSGALASTVLEALTCYGCGIFSMHPLQSFAEENKALCDLPHTYFCIEGTEARTHELEAILNTCGNKYFMLKPEQKTLYHAAACMISNYFVTLMHHGLQLLECVNISKDIGYEAMLPLITGTLQNVSALGTENALTGPISRGDVKTIEKHLQAIQAAAPHQLALYTALAEETLKLASLSKLKNPDAIDKLKTLLSGNNKETNTNDFL